jgi:transposase
MLEAGLLWPIAVPSPQQRADRELVRQRERLGRRRRQSMVQIRGFLLTYGITPPVGRPGPWYPSFRCWLAELKLEDSVLQATLDSLRRSFQEADAHLRDHTRLLRRLAAAPGHAALVALLSSVPGIGWLTALTFSVEVFDWSRFRSGEALSAFLGLTPSQHSSGERVRHGSITHSGNRLLRSLLVESCWTAIRADAGLRQCYEVLKQRRGAKRAIVAIARKMCHRLVAMVRSGELYRLEAAA